MKDPELREPKFKTIDMSSYPRIEQFNYFNSLAYPYVGITINLDITHLKQVVEKNNLRMFLTTLYILINAANKMPEFKQRIVDNNKIIEYDNCLSSHIVLRADKIFTFCSLDTAMPYKEYIKIASIRHEAAKTQKSMDKVATPCLYYVSCMPWIAFTALVQPTPIPSDSNPRFTIGKIFSLGDKIYIPLTVQVNHALMDGYHLGVFVKQLQEDLDAFEY